MANDKNYDLNTVKGRLLTYLRDRRITQTEFCKKLGVAPTYIGVMRKSIPSEKVNRIIELYPDLSRDWLLYGEGSMTMPGKETAERLLQSEGYEVPLLPVSAFAGNIDAWSQSVALADCEKIISPIPGVDYAIRITGDSMEPEFQDGCMVLIKRINESIFIPWGHPMVIDTANGTLIKDVYPSEKGDSYIEARSINPKYPPFNIAIDNVFGLYRVVTSLKVYTTY